MNRRYLWDHVRGANVMVVDASELDAARERERELIGLLRTVHLRFEARVVVHEETRRQIREAIAAFDARERGGA